MYWNTHNPRNKQVLDQEWAAQLSSNCGGHFAGMVLVVLVMVMVHNAATEGRKEEERRDISLTCSCIFSADTSFSSTTSERSLSRIPTSNLPNLCILP
jgi:hypothetical protein